MWKRGVQILWKSAIFVLLFNRGALASKVGTDPLTTDDIPDIIVLNNRQSIIRDLSASSAQIGNFTRLECNPSSWTDCSTLVSGNLPASNEPLIVPCGQCYTFDVTGEVTFSGIDVRGKLLFPNNHKVVIRTKYVIVQGELELTSDQDISPANEATRFVLTGSNNVMFRPTEAPNQNACSNTGNNNSCNIGVKPFVIAGGQVKIQGMAESCATHTTVKQQIYKDPTYTPADFPTFASLPSSCPTSGTQYISYNFDNNHVGNWTGRDGAFTVAADGALTVTRRRLTDRGPHLDITPMFPELCLVPDQDYLFLARIKLDLANGTMTGEDTTCKATNENCPTLFFTFHDGDNYDSTTREKGKIHQHNAPVYGQYVDFTSTVTFTEEEISAENAYYTLSISGPEKGVDITIDSFELSLPSQSSYQNPNALCDELILNGNAETNGFNPYPMTAVRPEERLKIIEEDGNKFWRLFNRFSSASSIGYILDTTCFTRGVSYMFSSRVRLHHSPGFVGGHEEIYWYIHYRIDGLPYSKTIVNCDAQSVRDGWMICSGTFMIDEDLSELTDANSPSLRMSFKNTRDGMNYDVDYDDISIQYNQGYVDELVVDSNDVSCWGNDADVHVTSSFYYSSFSQKSNGFVSQIQSATHNGNGSTSLLMKNAATLPIISEEDNHDFAIEIALLSRNIIVEGDSDEISKGGYMQVLHTPDIPQKIQGLWFVNMGRVKEVDRFALQLLYNGNIGGTVVSKNSFEESNHRCISVEGTSNVTISDNVGFKTSGHCINVGFQSEFNLITKNLVSDTKNMRSQDKLSGESDDFSAAFMNNFNPNDYTHNTAVAGQRDGFVFNNNHRTRLEDGTWISNSIRQMKIGTFDNNVARSNNFMGMKFYYHESGEEIVLKRLKAVKNRQYGLELFSSRNVTLSDSIFADNTHVGIKVRWVDNMNITNATIRGVTAQTKALVDATYFNKPCTASFDPPVGLKIPTGIHKWDRTNNIGAILTDVQFTDFHHFDRCSPSVPISFHYDDNFNNHFDYTTMFENVTFDGMKMMDAISSNDNGVRDIVIHDIDGSSDKLQQAAHGMFVSNVQRLKAFADQSCVSYEKGISYCANTCYRTVSFMVDQSQSDKFDVRITRLLDDKEILLPFSYKHDSDNHTQLFSERFRFFSASLPSGEYLVEFMKDFQPQWPRFVLQRWEGIPACSGYAGYSNITIFEPTSSCDDLILNGDMEAGIDYWKHRNGGGPFRGELLAVEGEGMNGSRAIRYTKRESQSHGVGQNLDSRCLRQSVNELYEIEIHFRLEEGSSTFICNPFSSSISDRCPYVTFMQQKYVDENLVTVSSPNKASVIIPNDEGEMSIVHGVFRVDEELKTYDRIFMYLENVHKRFDMIADNVSVKKLFRKCDEELIRNGDFEADSKYWKSYGDTHFDIETSNNQKSMKVFNKNNPDHGISQDLFIDSSCFRVGDRYEIIGKFRLESASSGTGQICDRTARDGQFECSYITIYAKNETEFSNTRYAETIAIAPDAFDTWSIMAGIVTVTETEASHDLISIRLFGSHQHMNVFYDDVSVKPLPRMCNDLVLNGNFESGDSRFWLPSDNRNILVDIANVGANGSSYSMMIQKYSSNRMRQSLDTRCLTEGQELLISAKFKLVSSTDFTTGLSCSPSILSDTNPNACPTVQIRGINCAGAEMLLILWNENNGSWNADDFNDYEKVFTVCATMATCEKVFVEVGRRVHGGKALLVDDVKITQRTTMPPTPFPTFSPTKGLKSGPTSAPTQKTNAPSGETIVACPAVGAPPTKIPAGAVIIAVAGEASICSLVKEINLQNNQKTSIPIALSYENNPWEQAAGEFAQTIIGGKDILCYSSGCQIDLPVLSEDGLESYVLISSSYTLSRTNEYARFLETSTFGITEDDLQSIDVPSSDVQDNIASWISQQMNLSITPMSSHREFWRRGLNGRVPRSVRTATTDHPCDQYSRWRTISFVHNDNRIEKFLRVRGSGPFVLEYNGWIRTVVANLTIDQPEYSNYEFDPNIDYSLCGSPEERLNGSLEIRLEDGNCVTTQNPKINLDGYEDSIVNIVNLPDGILKPIDQFWTNGEEQIFMSEASLFLSDPTYSGVCSSLPLVTELNNAPIFGKLSNGTWLIYDPRIDTETNTPASPLLDGGKEAVVVSGGETFCSNVARNFLNEQECKVSSDACQSKSSRSQVEIVLENSTIATLNSLTDRYVYGIKGLLVNYENIVLDHPCTPGLRSRWEPKNPEDCVPTELYKHTYSSLSDLLHKSGDSNPYIRDIHFPQEGVVCDDRDMDPEIEIEVDGACWRRVHDEHFSVFDLTYWVDRHPGGVYNIQKWSENNGTFLIYPSLLKRQPHGMANWNNNWHKFTYVGRFGDSIMLTDLPSTLRTVDVTNYFDDTGEVDASQVLVCGSPGEVANNRDEGFLFDSNSDFSTVRGWARANSKKYVWLMLALQSADQLRQRVAWVLAQTLVVVGEAIGGENNLNEGLLSYHDIFVKNAFGSYRDVLKEVSFNPLMAENLSFRGSKSSAYMMERYKVKASADENFAREIMQLFSMGILQLNMDGSYKVDENGKSILSYTNDDIMSLSRAWTGFDVQENRGNIEMLNANRVDPMRIIPEWRDRFPKSDTTGGYIGDGYPLCTDFPERSFLRKGAKYRFLGSSPLPELMSDPSEFATNGNGDIERVILDEASSSLWSLLCNRDQSGNCVYETTVTVNENFDCAGIECEIQAPRVVQVSNNAFFEYVQPPCVNMVFYNDPVKVSPRKSTDPVMCADPNTAVAAEACCGVGEVTATRNSKFSGERMTLSMAESRCALKSKSICDFYTVNDGSSYLTSGYFWTSDSCLLRVKVKQDGTVAVVHQPSDFLERVMYLDQQSAYYFKVHWERGGEYPLVTNNCDNVCDVLLDGSCLCNTRVIESVVFDKMPKNIGEISSKLNVGAVDPAVFDENTYSVVKDVETSITAYLKNGVYDGETVFEYIDDKGRKFFMKNLKSSVFLRSIAGATFAMSFRNSPQFMSFVPSETTLRDAQYETEAVLDHYFYHDNTAPFLASRFIQRSVMSNPTPRYIHNVAMAFKKGSYSSRGLSFGSGQYGDLAATFAAIYLDSAARSVVLDDYVASGSLREPILKVLAIMRSMKFVSQTPVTRVDNLLEGIGQMAYEFPTVFSFFLPEFKPYGRVGDASLVSPEALLLDMPKVIGSLNGLTSMIKFGLSSCQGGWGYGRCAERTYTASHLGVLEFNRTTSSDSETFLFETFEGPSLKGGFDNTWVGRLFESSNGKTVRDPRDSDNHVISFPTASLQGDFFSSQIQNNANIVVKFRHLSTDPSAKGCIGYLDGSNTILNTQTWVLCNGNKINGNQMNSDDNWISCQFVVPQELSSFRVVVGDRTSSGGGNAYFDDIQIGSGNETTCVGVNMPILSPPGQEGYSNIVVDNLATLLTAGRLNNDSRAIIVEAFDEAGSAQDGLRIAQQLMITSAEFHSTNTVKNTDQLREETSFPEPTGKPYKAVIYLMFLGGCDSFNMLTPYSCSNGLYDTYLDVRQQVAIPKNQLLSISATNQVCSEFGIHSALPVLRDLYDDQDLLFFANTGVLSQPVNKDNYHTLTNTRLFAHNHMQHETRKVDPYDSNSGTGILGRMTDLLTKEGHNIGSFSVGGFSVAVAGTPGESDAQMIINSDGIPELFFDDIDGLLQKLHNTTESDSGIFADTWSSTLVDSIVTNKLLSTELNSLNTQTTFPDTYLGQSFETISKIISTRDIRGADVDTFYIEKGGFDTHADIEEKLNILFAEVNGALEAFTQEMKAENIWNNVTLIQTSDFARTLNPNGGDGTDHAWGGNYFMMGGSVNGGKVLGSYPEDITDSGPFTLSRGRMIPTTPWEAPFHGIASWLGVSELDMNDVCPNIHNFNSTYLINPNEMFEGLPEFSPVPNVENSVEEVVIGVTNDNENDRIVKGGLRKG